MLWSTALHAALLVLVSIPWSLWFAGQGSPAAALESHYVATPLSPAEPQAEESTCRGILCIAEGPRPTAHSEPPSPQGEELEFLDDTGHALIAALRRSGGLVAIVSRSDRWHALALHRAVDGKNLGSGADVAAYPLRVVVHEPESYPEIASWLASVGPAPESLRTIAIFPAETQQRLHEAIEAEAKRIGLPPGTKHALVAISSAEPIGIAVRSVALQPEIPPRGGN